MCEILFKAVDAPMTTVIQWRTRLTAALPMMQQYLSDHFDVPIVEANYKRLVEYRDAKAAYKINPAQKYLDIITAYEANPLIRVEIDKVVAYYREDKDESGSLKPNVVSLWKYYKNQVGVEAVKTDAVKEAEILAKDRRGGYKRGDPVVVMKDGHEWGKEERLPKFFVVKITDLAVEAAKKYTQSELGDVPDTDGIYPIVRRRLFHFLVDNIPVIIKNQLLTTGSVTVTLTQIRNYIQNKKTLATE